MRKLPGARVSRCAPAGKGGEGAAETSPERGLQRGRPLQRRGRRQRRHGDRRDRGGAERGRWGEQAEEEASEGVGRQVEEEGAACAACGGPRRGARRPLPGIAAATWTAELRVAVTATTARPTSGLVALGHSLTHLRRGMCAQVNFT